MRIDKANSGTMKSSEAFSRNVRSVRPWEYQVPFRFVSLKAEHSESVLVVLRGRIGILLFPAAGKLVQTVKLGGKGEARELKVPSGTYFTAITLAPESALVEVFPVISPAVCQEQLPGMPVPHSPEARDMWYRWFTYHQTAR